MKKPTEDNPVLIEGEVIRIKDGKFLSALVRTETGPIDIRIFHPTAYHRRYLVRGAEIRLSGKLTRWRGRRQMVNPRIFPQLKISSL